MKAPSPNNVFQDLFKNFYEPFYVEKQLAKDGRKNKFQSIELALASASNDTLIKINTGLYVETLNITVPNLRIQTYESMTNVTLINASHPIITVNLPQSTDKVFMESIKFAHLGEQPRHMIKWPNLKELKETKYRKLFLGPNMNTCLHVKKGTLQLDECRISLAALKDNSRLISCIVVEEEGVLIMNRCEVLGSLGTIGIYCHGGKIFVRESLFRGHGGIGILACGSKATSVLLKNSIFSKCNQGIVLNGPFCGSVENNAITSDIGILTLCGNSSNIITNELKDCNVAISIENSCPTFLKNIISNSTTVGMQIWARMNNPCWPVIKLNTFEQNVKGGIFLSGSKNTALIANNVLRHNGFFGIHVEDSASPHIFLNEILNTLGNGVRIRPQSTAFLQKNCISGSLNCNLILEGPGNIDNYIYNNRIRLARGHGILLTNSEKFLISSNDISMNFNGIFSNTSVVTLEENTIYNNKSNGVMLVNDNQIQLSQNTIRSNNKAGVLCRDTSRAQMSMNSFQGNKFEVVVEAHHELMDTIEEDNYFTGFYDIRLPKNYQCQLI